MEEKLQKEEVPITWKKRRVLLFKRRKKPTIRHFVQQKKHREYRKTITRILVVVVALFVLVVLLFIVQKYLIPNLFLRNTVIISPQLNPPLSHSEIEKLIRESSSDISSVQFSTGSAAISYQLHGVTTVYLSPEKDIKQQLVLVMAIDKQITGTGKQAISIDLRYNKPIVKF
jgi:hypothetical protein